MKQLCRRVFENGAVGAVGAGCGNDRRVIFGVVNAVCAGRREDAALLVRLVCKLTTALLFHLLGSDIL